VIFTYKYRAGDVVIGKIDNEICEAKVINMEAGISRDAIIVEYKNKPHTMLTSTIINRNKERSSHECFNDSRPLQR
jgi:hypothetical protein